jgi:rod shape-determining protein MreD
MSHEMRGQPAATTRDLSWLYLSLLGVAAAILIQATLLTRVRLWGVTANLLLVIAVTWSLGRGLSQGMLWGFVGGLGLDLVTGLPLGASALGLMAACVPSSLGKGTIFAGNLALPIVIVALATSLYGWVVLALLRLTGSPVDWLASTVRVILPEMILNCLLIVPVYPLLARWSRPA